MRRAADILLSRREEIIETTIREVGGVRKFAEIVVYFAWSILDASSTYPMRVTGQIVPTESRGEESLVYRRPLGVIGIISPWNSPINLTMRSLAPALAWQPGLTAAADASRGTPRTPEQRQAFFQAMANAKNENHYKVVDSLLARNCRLAGTGTGAKLEYKDIDASFLEMIRTQVTSEEVQYNSDQTHRNYLHPVEGSEAALVGAGLFSV
jgi:hypothetical protein